MMPPYASLQLQFYARQLGLSRELLDMSLHNNRPKAVRKLFLKETIPIKFLASVD